MIQHKEHLCTILQGTMHILVHILEITKSFLIQTKSKTLPYFSPCLQFIYLFRIYLYYPPDPLGPPKCIIIVCYYVLIFALKMPPKRPSASAAQVPQCQPISQPKRGSNCISLFLVLTCNNKALQAFAFATIKPQLLLLQQ